MTVNIRTVASAVASVLLFASLFAFAVGGAAEQPARLGQASLISHLFVPASGHLSFAGTVLPARATTRTTRAAHRLPFLAHGGLNNSVSWTTYNLSIVATSNPPAATQPSPGTALATDDDRLLVATWSNGVLWTAGNDACTPPGDSSVRSCLRLIEVSLSSGSPLVTQDFDAGAVGSYLFNPSVVLDGSGDLAVDYSASSASLAAGVGTAGQVAGSAPNTLGSGPWIESGAGDYVDGSSGERWGDYSGAATTPVTNSGGWSWGPNVWVDGEYTAAANTHDWGTAAAQLTFGTSGGSGSPNSITLSANPSTLTAGSGQTSKVTAVVSSSSLPVGGDTVSFTKSGTCGSLSAASSTTGSTGTAAVTYTAATAAGTCTITATESKTGSSASTTVNQKRGHK